MGGGEGRREGGRVRGRGEGGRGGGGSGDFNGLFCRGKFLAFAHVTLIHFTSSPQHSHAVCLFFCLFKFTSLQTGRVNFLSPNI